LYATAITSISIHSLWQRKCAEEDRARIQAHVSILEDLAARLRSDDAISGQEVAKLRQLASGSKGLYNGPSAAAGEMGWLEVLWGRRQSVVDQTRSDEYEQRDLD
ncbi:hypothetical protein CONPUDRAFT_34734, partial [Coniophora puteana RWD-64-598 SS2]